MDDWQRCGGDIDILDHLPAALAMSPSNTATGIDHISYPFNKFWMKKFPDTLRRLLNVAITTGIEDWHESEVVLIPKANRPQYNLVKAWRMIYLLPTLSKVLGRMVLLKLAGHIDLEDTQFGSQRKRGIHDSLAVVYEFLEYNKLLHTALFSMDIEAGLDKVDSPMLCQLLCARGAPFKLVQWIRGRALQRRVRFRFNGRISKKYWLGKGIPQGSPLSPLCLVFMSHMYSDRGCSMGQL